MDLQVVEVVRFTSRGPSGISASSMACDGQCVPTEDARPPYPIDFGMHKIHRQKLVERMQKETGVEPDSILVR